MFTLVVLSAARRGPHWSSSPPPQTGRQRPSPPPPRYLRRPLTRQVTSVVPSLSHPQPRSSSRGFSHVHCLKN